MKQAAAFFNWIIQEFIAQILRLARGRFVEQRTLRHWVWRLVRGQSGLQLFVRGLGVKFWMTLALHSFLAVAFGAIAGAEFFVYFTVNTTLIIPANLNP